MVAIYRKKIRDFLNFLLFLRPQRSKTVKKQLKISLTAGFFGSWHAGHGPREQHGPAARARSFFSPIPLSRA